MVEPLPHRPAVLGGDTQIAFEVGDLRGFALAFHEQNPVELERGRIVQVLAPLEGTHRGFGHAGR